MTAFQPIRRVHWAALVVLIALFCVPHLPAQTTTGIQVMVNGKGPFKSGTKLAKDGYQVSERTVKDTYAFVIPRTKDTGLDKLGWKMSTKCSGIEYPKEGAVTGVVLANTARVITLNAG